MSYEMKWTQVFFALSLTVGGVYSDDGVVYSDTTVTIHPQWLAQGGNANYDNNRWNKHFGLDQTNLIPNCRRLRTDSGRFPGPENTGYLIKKWPEDPNRSGYPDPNYLKNVSREQGLCPDYLENINTGYENDMILVAGVAEKLHARFNIKVAGPTIGSYTKYADLSNFSYWDKVADFMDGTLGYIDVFSFHSYNNLVVSGRSYNFTGANEARLVAFIDLVENYASQKTGKMIPLVISEYGRDAVSGLDKYAPSPIIDFSTIYQSNGHKFTQLGLREYIDRAVVFLLASEERPGRYTLNYSLFSPDGEPTRIVDFFEFWYKFRSGFSFIRTNSQYDGKERTVSPLAMSSSSTNETVILLHSYSRRSQAVKLVFQEDWIKPTTGQATCITIKDDWFPVITFNKTIDIQKTQGIVELPPEATCHFTFNIPSNKLPSVTLNETTYYGADTLIPIKGDVVSTVISLPNGQYDSARLRVSTSWLINETISVSYVTFNDHRVDTFFKLYDSDKFNPASNTYWTVWEFLVPVPVFVLGRTRYRFTSLTTWQRDMFHLLLLSQEAGSI
ncbi:beta-porphyranase A-like isoform X2 [Haliotis rubra]|uniref:beta-porphyranase A-like isoform X2 n=1 Tax=Haliotis rubra TaxID=36100 RepID=UPI001EE54238|nr:beta-porphyranase A-like isoform X2 [Haliotis rubra]